MIKKILWIVAALYPVSMLFILLANAREDQTFLSLIPGLLIFLIPLAVLIFELRDGKATNFFVKLILLVAYLGSFLFLGVGTAGYYAFNSPTPLNLIKGIPLLITLFALFYFAFKRVLKKKKKA